MMEIMKMMTTTPTLTPIAAHFETLLGSSDTTVGRVVSGWVDVAGLMRTSTLEMFAPIADSSADC